MAHYREPKDEDASLDPEDVNSEPRLAANCPAPDPNDEIPVPDAMSAAEVDERAQTVEALRIKAAAECDDDSSMRD